MARVDFAGVAFAALALLTLGSAARVAFARSVVHSALALSGTLLGMAGFYVMLSADFLAAVQLLVYIGGTLVLLLAAAMLVARAAPAETSNERVTVGRRGAGCVTLVLAFVLVVIALDTLWPLEEKTLALPSTAKLGHALLGPYALPLEILALVLLATMLGTLVIARRALKSDAPR
jgi:NADH-quinone oxidoreductase subunit J